MDKKKMGGTQETFTEKVYEIVGRHLDADRVAMKPESKLVDDLGADDLALIEILIEFEEQFEFDIPDGELFSAGETTQETMKDVVCYLLSRIEFTP
jgi:acyl carrier protein